MTVVDYVQRRILVVSHGGICRAPMAAGVLSHLLREGGRGDAIQVDLSATATLATDVLILNSLRNLAPHGWGAHPRLLARYAGLGVDNIVDPYGGTTGDYEMALNLIEASCKGVAAALP